MIESICLMHFIGAGALVGLFILAGYLIKPAPIITPMSPTEEKQFDLIQVNASNKMTIVQMKENVPHGNKQTITSNQEPSGIQGNQSGSRLSNIRLS